MNYHTPISSFTLPVLSCQPHHLRSYTQYPVRREKIVLSVVHPKFYFSYRFNWSVLRGILFFSTIFASELKLETIGNKKRLSKWCLQSPVCAAWFTAAKARQQPKCLTMNDWVKEIMQWNIALSWERRKLFYLRQHGWIFGTC